jgi:hypothetical protein
MPIVLRVGAIAYHFRVLSGFREGPPAGALFKAEKILRNVYIIHFGRISNATLSNKWEIVF